MPKRPTRPLTIATAAGFAGVWALYAIDPTAWPGVIGATTQSGLLVVNFLLTWRRPRLKVQLVRLVQGRLVNPVVRRLLRIGVNPLGLVLLETRGRRTGLPRVVPVGNGQRAGSYWVVAEHGLRAGYVRNVLADPRVRLGIVRRGRVQWVCGVATVVPADDIETRLRFVVGRNPLRALNAWAVQLLGAEPVTVRVDILGAELASTSAAELTPLIG